MLIPYNVDRPTRLVPKFTYGLMGINIAIYLMTIIHANILLPGEKATYREDRGKLEQSFFGESADSGEFDPSQNPDAAGTSPGVSAPGVPGSGAPTSPNVPEAPPMPGSEQSAPPSNDFSFGTTAFDASKYGRWQMAPGQMAPGQMPPGQAVPNQATLDDDSGAVSSDGSSDGASDAVSDNPATAASLSDEEDPEEKKMKTKDGFHELQLQVWRAAHKDDLFVLEPHPSALYVFAYYPAEATLWSFITSMFLHADLEHLLGNMLFLWVFGRATEDAMGQWLYLAAYLVCGYAAILLYHIMAMNFTPAAGIMPALGASGAIAGVMGLFAPRFYRTPVRVFYTTWYGLRILGPVTLILGLLFANVLELGTPGYTLGTLCGLAAVVFFGEDTAWREFRLAAMWLIGGWTVLKDVLPALIDIATKSQGGGVAHWAHIGGLLCGLAYAFLIGANKEGKAEYLIEDARRSLDNKYASNAIEHAQKLVREMPEKAEGYQLLAEAYDHKNEADKALDNFELAIEKYLKTNERDQAMRLYTEVLQKHPLFILKPKTQFAIANQMAVRGHFDTAAENWAKIPFTFPDAPEGEQALLRAGQVYIERLNQTEMGLHLLNTILERNPQTSLKTQVNTIIHRVKTPAATLADDPVKAMETPKSEPQKQSAAPKPVEKPVAQKTVVQKPTVQQPVVEKPVVEKPVVEKPIEAPVVSSQALSDPLLQPIAFDVVTQESDMDTNLLPAVSMPAQTLPPKPAEPAKNEEPALDDLLAMPMNFSKPSDDTAK